MEKIKKEFGMERIEVWCKDNDLIKVLGPVKKESSELKTPVTKPKDQIIPSKHKQNTPPTQSSSQYTKKKFVKKSSKSKNGVDEIDDIFNLF